MYYYKLLFSSILFSSSIIAASAKQSTKTLYSDKEVEVKVIYEQSADISMDKWLYFSFENKSKVDIDLTHFVAKIGSIRTVSGKTSLNPDFYGYGVKNSLFFWDNEANEYNQYKFIIKAKDKIISNGALANYILALYIGRKPSYRGEGFHLSLEFRYDIGEVERSVEVQEELKDLSITEVEDTNLKAVRNRMLSLSQDNYHQMSTKSYIEKILYSNDLTKNLLRDDELIAACFHIERSQRHRPYHLILKERGSIPTVKLTRHYAQKIRESDTIGLNIIPIGEYWANSLINVMIQSKKRSSDKYYQVNKNKEAWILDEKLQTEIFEYFNKKDVLTASENINNGNIYKWQNQFKYLAMTEHPKAIRFFEKLLDDERIFKVKRRGQFRRGFKRMNEERDIREKRICDLAFGYLFSALGLYQSMPDGDNKDLYLNSDFLEVMKFYDMRVWVEKTLVYNSIVNTDTYNLNPERKKEIKKIIARRLD